jgi:hypothetical protein
MEVPLSPPVAREEEVVVVSFMSSLLRSPIMGQELSPVVPRVLPLLLFPVRQGVVEVVEAHVVALGALERRSPLTILKVEQPLAQPV